ncbi:MAG: hypothetical protein Ct9H90mP18_01340 [Gammaproteobacteria bacterium]|nr:MAG: hypothetical protein Ct9H90mP18_01340 [Gammaproteobacteria bacterium]
MADAFMKAGFNSFDVHTMIKLLIIPNLMVSCMGGFSYGDVLGAGRGWAKKIFLTIELESRLRNFLMIQTKFSLGV